MTLRQCCVVFVSAIGLLGSGLLFGQTIECQCVCPLQGPRVKAVPGQTPSAQPDSRVPRGSPGKQIPQLPITGRILLESEAYGSDELEVELVCRGSAVRRSRVSDQGNFVIRLDTNNFAAVTQSSVNDSPPWWEARSKDSAVTGEDRSGAGYASPLGGKGLGGGDSLEGCLVRVPPRADLESEIVFLRDQDLLINPDIGTIRVYDLSPSDKANRAYSEARKELGKKKPKHSRAARELEKAVDLFPEFPQAWNLLGQVRLAQQDAKGAREAFAEALKVDARFRPAAENLTRLEMGEGRWAEAANLTKGLLQAKSPSAESYYLDGLIKYNLGQLEEAVASLRQADQTLHFQDHSNVHLYLGASLANLDHTSEAADQFQLFLDITPETLVSDELRKRLKTFLEEHRDD